MKQVRLLDEKASVHSDSNVASPIVAELHANDEFSVGKTVNVSGTNWYAATLSDGRTGYVADAVEVFWMRPVALAQSYVDVFMSPTVNSKLRTTYKKGAIFTLAGVVKRGELEWVEIRTDSGDVGFIPAGTEIKEVDANVGILMILAGICSLVISPSTVGGIAMVLALGAALYSFARKPSSALVCTWIFVVVTGLSALRGLMVHPIALLIQGGVQCLLGLWALWTLRLATSSHIPGPVREEDVFYYKGMSVPRSALNAQEIEHRPKGRTEDETH
jgi:hypothetical protein